MATSGRTHGAAAALLLATLAAALVSFQSWGIAASLAAATVGGLVGLRRGLSLPAALAASSAAGAALVHFGVAPEHFGEWWGFGLFFVLCGEVQLGWAFLLGYTRSRRLPAIGIAGSLFLVALWAVSRTTGLPLGPEAGVPEPVGIPDLVSVALELVTAAACWWMLLAPHRIPRGRHLAVRALGFVGAVALTFWALAAVAAA